MEQSKVEIDKGIHGNSLRTVFSTFLLAGVISVTIISPTLAGDGDGGGPQLPPPGPLPPASVQPLPSDAPAPWGTDPATLPGVRTSDTIKGNGFLQETITLPNGNSFFFQSIATSDFSVDSYVKRTEGISNDPVGNLIFNQNLKDPAWGLTDHTFINGFKQPIQMHFDIVERKVVALTSGFNQMDMHFRQMPFLDTATGRIRNRQDIGIWITGIAGIQREEVTTDQRFTPREANLFHRIATATNTARAEESRVGAIDFWNDLQVVKITDAATNQLVTFSKCNDFRDPTGRWEEHIRNSAGTRNGCFGGTGPIPTRDGDRENDANTFRPAIPGHDLDTFQLTPLNWDRWRGNGGMKLISGGEGGFGGQITFPDKTLNTGNNND
jgi:hypothetical protein